MLENGGIRRGGHVVPEPGQPGRDGVHGRDTWQTSRAALRNGLGGSTPGIRILRCQPLPTRVGPQVPWRFRIPASAESPGVSPDLSDLMPDLLDVVKRKLGIHLR